VLVNKVTHMHTYIIPCKPTPITLSVLQYDSSIIIKTLG